MSVQRAAAKLHGPLAEKPGGGRSLLAVEFAQARASGCADRTIAFIRRPLSVARSRWRLQSRQPRDRSDDCLATIAITRSQSMALLVAGQCGHYVAVTP